MPSLGQGTLLSSESIASPFREEVLKSLESLNNAPTLIGILSTNSKPSRFYAEFTQVSQPVQQTYLGKRKFVSKENL